jgi:hypothetical protein
VEQFEGNKPLGRQGKDEKVILKRIFKKSDGGMDYISLAQSRDRRRALVSAVMNIQVPKMRGFLDYHRTG